MLDATPVGQTVTVEEVSAALRERGYYPFTAPTSPPVYPPVSPVYPEIPVFPPLSLPIPIEPPYTGPVSPSISPAVIVAGVKSPWLLILLLGGLVLLSGKDKAPARKKFVGKSVYSRRRVRA